MKGLILSGGRGTRLRPLTFTRAKQLIPIANKPNLHYVIEDLRDAGIHDIGIILSPETGDEVRAALGQGDQWGVSFTFIVQDQPLGLAHAVKTAQPYLGQDPFLMYLGDNLLSGGIDFMVKHYRDLVTTHPEAAHSQAMILLTPVDNPQQFGVALLNEAGQVIQLVEKPQEPQSNLALVGVYLFSPAIHEVIATLQPSQRGEYEITDAIQGLVDRGCQVGAYQVRGWWKDTGRADDLLDANRLVLSQITRHIEGNIDQSDIMGDVVIEAGAKVIRSQVRGPAHIARGAVIEDSYIGPYTSIGSQTQVIRSEVEYSILMNQVILQDLPYRMDSSVLGQYVKIHRDETIKRKQTIQLVLGDRSQVHL